MCSWYLNVGGQIKFNEATLSHGEKYDYRKALISCGPGKKHCSFHVTNGKYNREHKPGMSYFQPQTILNLFQSYMVLYLFKVGFKGT